MRAPVGIYVEGDVIRFYGRRQAEDPAGLAWHDGLTVTARALLDGTDDKHKLLRWDGATVRVRSRADVDAIDEAGARSRDDGFFDDERNAALVEAIVAEFNAATGSSITRDAVRTAYRVALGRS